MNKAPSARPRPLSPHLTIYRFRPTMAMSIIHRITGAALYFGTLLVAWWLIAAAMGEDAFAVASRFFGSWFGLLILLGYSWALIHHMLGGIRYLIWDTATAMEKHTATSLAVANIVGSLALTVLLWGAVLIFR